ncbi:MAG TPA: DUF2334 domain-containing protein [Hyphomonadaceae bacterium]|nr:DUF2334 domain-containing protein [Hyphomonadaceae bacterium]
MLDFLALARLNHELAIWRRAWKSPVLWWRDDDAREPTWQLKRLLHVRGELPLTLAVIPDGNMPELAARLEGVEGITIAQHGVDHENRLPAGGARSEFPEWTRQEEINVAVAAGQAKMVSAGLDPRLFVPPWNEPTDMQLTAVAAVGYDTYSTGAFGSPRNGLKHVGAQIDVLRWKGQPHFKGRRRIFDAIRAQLEKRRETGDFEEPIGILTHHLVHD